MDSNRQEVRPATPSFKLVWVPVSTAFALVAAYGLYFGLYRSSPAGQPASWGEFGDFLGGLLNPVVGIVTVVLLVRTLASQQQAIDMQRLELSLQRIELINQREETARSTEALNQQHRAIARQAFEQTFFAWLQSYRQLIELITSHDGLSGQLVLSQYARWLSGAAAAEVLRFGTSEPDTAKGTSYEEAIQEFLSSNGENRESRLLAIRFNRALSTYHDIYNDNHPKLGPILRTLYRLLEWIDASELSNSDKWHYAAIVRSQLSSHELIILAYNGCTTRGRNFVRLIEKYALFDNLESENDGLIRAMREAFVNFPLENFPYTRSAFSSGWAKVDLGVIQAKDL